MSLTRKARPSQTLKPTVPPPAGPRFSLGVMRFWLRREDNPRWKTSLAEGNLRHSVLRRTDGTDTGDITDRPSPTVSFGPEQLNAKTILFPNRSAIKLPCRSNWLDRPKTVETDSKGT
jgi:hypothetical protein